MGVESHVLYSPDFALLLCWRLNRDPVMPHRFWSKFNIAVFEDLTYRDVLPLFSPWFAVTTTANILNAAYVISMVSYGQASLPDAVRILLAVGAALEWTALLQVCVCVCVGGVMQENLSITCNLCCRWPLRSS